MNQTAVDKWTLAHIGSGLLAGVAGLSAPIAIGGAVLYEVVEHEIESTKAGQRLFGSSGPESLLNAVTDVAVYTAAYYVAREGSR